LVFLPDFCPAGHVFAGMEHALSLTDLQAVRECKCLATPRYRVPTA
jgi:hypothetical protein